MPYLPTPTNDPAASPMAAQPTEAVPEPPGATTPPASDPYIPSSTYDPAVSPSAYQPPQTPAAPVPAPPANLVGATPTIPGTTLPSWDASSGYLAVETNRASYAPTPAPPPPPPAASTSYGGPDPNAPRITTGLVQIINPVSGQETWRRIPRGRSAVEDYARGPHAWVKAPTEWQAMERTPETWPPPPPRGGDGTGVDWRGRELRPPTDQRIQPIPLPVTDENPSWRDFLGAWQREHGIWPLYRLPWQDDLGAPLIGAPRGRSG